MANRGRQVGETKATGFQVGARRTFDVAPDRAWEILTSGPGLEAWLGQGAPARIAEGTALGLDDGTSVEVRVFRPGSHLRLSAQAPGASRPSTIQLRIVPRDERTTVAFHQEHLGDAAERDVRKAFFLETLVALAPLLEDA